MISKYFIERPVLANVIAILMIVAGVVAVRQLPISEYPDVTPPTVQVTTNYPGATARTVIDTVALPIEQQVNGVEGMIYMQSYGASDGSYKLTVTFAVGTDPDLALKTRRGTGYYKVPSLKGVWYRGMFGHSGWCATLEDWFDPRRTRNDYVPAGFKPYGTKTYAVRGHAYGLNLSVEDRKALIAFLRTI